ncbi:hypothetical protein HAX54_011946, partial [Datura stramonium]|nr:hypothetical protein [Datura stramonium]
LYDIRWNEPSWEGWGRLTFLPHDFSFVFWLYAFCLHFLRSGSINNSFPLLKKKAINYFVFFSVSLSKPVAELQHVAAVIQPTVAMPSSSLYSPPYNCLRTKVEAVESV